MSSVPDFFDILKAKEVIHDFAHVTPVLRSSTVDEKAGCDVFFKCENFQKVGAFKFRGACNAIMTLSDKEAKKGVATHSSGNHAQAVALAAKMRNIPAYIVMPENAPAVKIAAVKDYGAEITFCTPTLQARESTLKEVVEKTGAHFIHPYDDARIIAGQGTTAMELIEQQPELDFILTPVGGGGLFSGSILAAKHLNPKIKLIGAEPELADDAYRSFKAGKLFPNTNTSTIADGLRTSLGTLPFSIIKDSAYDIITADEASIVDAMKFIWQRMNIIIEASCAVPVAVLFDERHRILFKGKKVGIILTGGNVDLEHLPF